MAELHNNREKKGFFKMLDRDRITGFDGVYNFRDIGGLPARDNRFMKKGLLFRSDSLHVLSTRDMEKIETLKIKTIIDLRTPNERKRKLFKGHNITSESIPIYVEPFKADSSSFKRLIDIVSGKYRKFDLVRFMMDCYLRIALDHCAEINKVMTLISERQNLPAVIHCTGGKDRTGWFSVLIQSIAGAPMDLIYEDYLLSNEFMFKDFERQQRMIKWFTFFQYDLKKARPMLEAREGYLQNALNAVYSRNSTIEEYLEKTCAVPEQVLNRLRSFLLE